MHRTMKQIPYGIDDFQTIIRDGYYYVDKTQYLPLLEKKPKYLFLLRPRRFGKSLLINMMASYYDVLLKDQFNELFGNLWISKHPTSLANSFQVLRFDFSRAGGSIDELENEFNEYCCNELDEFIEKYSMYYDQDFIQRVKRVNSARTKLNLITIRAKRMRYRLYLIIDEYDNFTNDVLASQGKEVFQDLLHADGFYRRFFKLFKGAFDRIFMIGISPVTMDDLTSGYNIDWNITLDPDFNSMLGFEEFEVKEMIEYYRGFGKITEDTESLIEIMKPWYDNYCFVEECYGCQTVYNCDMVLYFIGHFLQHGKMPKEMVDKNVRTDYSKLKTLISLDCGRQREESIRAIEEVANQGWINVRLKSSFPALQLTNADNFRSLMFYYGMLTISGGQYPRLKMSIPNEGVRFQYWQFLFEMYQQHNYINVEPLLEGYYDMICKGEWKPLLDKIGQAYYETTSIRDAIEGEHNVQGFFKAYLSQSDYSLLCPEMELNYGYSDFLMYPWRAIHSEASHGYIIEIKYAKTSATEEEVEKLYQEAMDQINKYSASSRLRKAMIGATLHGLIIIFKGPKMDICKEVYKTEL